MLLGQRLLGAKAFTAEALVIDRRAAVRALLADRGELVCVAGLGGTPGTSPPPATCDLDLPLWGAMGAAAMVGPRHRAGPARRGRCWSSPATASS